MNPRHDARQHPVEAVDLGRAGAGWHADHRRAVEPPKHQEIAGIDRHAEMNDLAAGRSTRGRDDIAPIDDRRGAEDQDRIVARGVKLRDRLAHGLDRMVGTTHDFAELASERLRYGSRWRLPTWR